MSIESAVQLAERKWGVSFHIKSKTEASAPCPLCWEADQDGFLVFDSPPRFWCRRCGQRGFLDKDNGHRLTEAELLEIRLQRIEREQAQMKRRLTALERLNQGHDYQDYHKLLDQSDREWWYSQGINDESIAQYQLGICYNCPTDSEHRPSYTIPIFDSHHTQLLNIRHRLIGVTNGDRYRPHMAGLPGKVLFNSQLVHQEKDLFLAEGCKKGVVLSQHGIPTMAVLGKYGFDLKWLKHFNGVKSLMLCPDPDAVDHWIGLGGDIAKESSLNVHVCSLPMKPDDLFIAGGTVADFEQFLRMSRKV